jgi:hypothetical protein
MELVPDDVEELFCDIVVTERVLKRKVKLVGA